MVAAAKLRRAQEAAESSRPYADKMAQVVVALAAGADKNNGSPLLCGTGRNQRHLIVVMTSDRGLCGGFNSSIVRAVRKKMHKLAAEGKEGYLLCVGSKGYDQLKGEFKQQILGKISDITKRKIGYTNAQHVSDEIFMLFKEHNIDVVTVVYNKFKSALTQLVTFQQLIPLVVDCGDGESAASAMNDKSASKTAAIENAPYEYEPDETTILEELLPRNITVQCFKALLESAASEQGARMTAMDNATRNAGEMIDRLSLQYNRTRQAAITTELTEIISGAEAV